MLIPGADWIVQGMMSLLSGSVLQGTRPAMSILVAHEQDQQNNVHYVMDITSASVRKAQRKKRSDSKGVYIPAVWTEIAVKLDIPLMGFQGWRSEEERELMVYCRSC